MVRSLASALPSPVRAGRLIRSVEIGSVLYGPPNPRALTCGAWHGVADRGVAELCQVWRSGALPLATELCETGRLDRLD
jgi:hypothetical protein